MKQTGDVRTVSRATGLRLLRSGQAWEYQSREPVENAARRTRRPQGRNNIEQR